MDEILNRLNVIFRDFFDDEDLNIDCNTVASDVPGWDSLEHITLMSVIESEFNIRFDLKKAIKFANVGELANEIQKQMKKSRK